MKKRLLLFLMLGISSIDFFAQQLPIFTQYQESMGFLNPAALPAHYFTHNHNLSIGATHRSQWVGFDGGPETQLIKGEYLFDNNNAFSFLTGGYLLHDKTDPLSTTGIYGKIGAVLTDDPSTGGFSIGLSGGMVQYRADILSLAIRDKNDITAQNYAVWYPDLGLGVFYFKKINRADFFYAGLSVPQVFGLDVMFENDQRDYAIERVQHVYALLGYLKRFDEDSYLEGSSWAKYAPNAPVNIDFNLRYQFNPSFWIGTGGSTAGRIHLETGVILDWNVGWENAAVRLGYAYNRYFTSYGPDNQFGAAHEINLTYSLLTN